MLFAEMFPEGPAMECWIAERQLLEVYGARLQFYEGDSRTRFRQWIDHCASELGWKAIEPMEGSHDWKFVNLVGDISLRHAKLGRTPTR